MYHASSGKSLVLFSDDTTPGPSVIPRICHQFITVRKLCRLLLYIQNITDTERQQAAADAVEVKNLSELSCQLRHNLAMFGFKAQKTLDEVVKKQNCEKAKKREKLQTNYDTAQASYENARLVLHKRKRELDYFDGRDEHIKLDSIMFRPGPESLIESTTTEDEHSRTSI